MDMREMLELAAKVHSIKGHVEETNDGIFFVLDEPSPYKVVDSAFWQPDIDDGDSFRLAMDLGMQVCMDPNWSNVLVILDMGGETKEFEREIFGRLPEVMKQTRLAVLEAAAFLEATLAKDGF